MFPKHPVDSDFKVPSKEGEECETRTLEEVAASVGSHAGCPAEEAKERESFVDIKGSLERETEGESEGLTFAEIPQRADLFSKILFC